MRIKWINTKQKASGMKKLAGRVGTIHNRKWALTVAQAGDSVVKDIARVDTGKMKGSTGDKAIVAAGTALAMAGYGITTAEPFYTKFQEFGTSHGIEPMNSILAANITMETTSHAAGDVMMRNIVVEWNSL